MIKLAIAPILLLLTSLASAAELTDMETRWLTAGSSVLAYAKQELQLPIDITVQPQARPTDVPLALGYQDGRCKLVLSMRGNPGAEDILASVPADQHPLMIEAMVAHELGHCWRYAHGIWHMLPAGFVEGNGSDPATRREEGYADLAALAWVRQRHPAQYADVAAWMRKVRQGAPAEGSHDTLPWLELAPAADVFNATQPPFEQADRLWRMGLQQQR